MLCQDVKNILTDLKIWKENPGEEITNLGPRNFENNPNFQWPSLY